MARPADRPAPDRPAPSVANHGQPVDMPLLQDLNITTVSYGSVVTGVLIDSLICR